MHIIIAPNAFKNSLTAIEAADAIRQGLTLSKLECSTACFPIADGGDGTGSLIIKKCKGTIIKREVRDPLGRMVTAQFGLIENGKTAIIEMADSSGLRLLKHDELNPLLASSCGTGELMGFALDEGVNKIIIAMGGSATVDGGCGILSALGIQFFDANNRLLHPSPQSLFELHRIDTSQLDERVLNCEVVVLCDVNNRLLGPRGSAAVFGPQKGATFHDVYKLDQFLSRLDELTGPRPEGRISEIKYGGTAGGAAAGLYAWLNARLVNGIEYFLELTRFEDELQKADMVITGEGSIDLQTLQGKGPFGVAEQAKKKNVPVIGLGGEVPINPGEELSRYFDVLMPIGNRPISLAEALNNTRENLIRTAKTIGDMLAIKHR
jgi:glycerate kinase